MLKNAIPKISAPKMQPFTVFIEGNIGAGKTTFLNHFRKYEDVCLHTEPVEKWRNVQGINLLVSFTLATHVTREKLLFFYAISDISVMAMNVLYDAISTKNGNIFNCQIQ